jgi:hypothetical protein
MILEILAKINETGKAIAFYCESVNFTTSAEKAALIADGCIEITETDYNKLLGNAGDGDNGTGYIYDSKVKTVVSAPAKPAPTADEIKAQKKAAIDANYKQVFDSLAADLVLAVLANNTTAQDSIKTDYKSAQDSYAKELGAL